MRRVTLYSSARRPGSAGPTGLVAVETPRPSDAPAAAPAAAPPVGVPRILTRGAAWRRVGRRRALLLTAGGLLLVVLAAMLFGVRTPPPRRITQQDIDAAVLHTLTTKSLPSRAAKAYAVIRPSVVEVRGSKDDEGAKHGTGSDVGTGVVIVDKGIILTNLHVVSDADRVQVVFADGLVSEATVLSVRPEHDLAVLQAKTIPDDLVPATLRSTRGLAPGDEVVAVGFPFGIGPSASAGIISGLRREFRSPRGQRLLTNLIQFDAAANPGNSGGPLVTMDGEVVGIVTGILNPTDQRVFVGIGFAVPIENAAAAVGLSPF
jgi:S1-C subfamily serine protease